MTPNRPTGVPVDVDGTLVDTTYLHTLCWWEALRQDGQDVPMSRIRRAIGMVVVLDIPCSPLANLA